MKGYRCDNCLDFVAERIVEPASWIAGGRYAPPETWITMRSGDEAIHVCSPACVAAWATRQSATDPLAQEQAAA